MRLRVCGKALTIALAGGVLIGTWELAAAASPRLVPHAWEILQTLVSFCDEERFQRDILAALLRTAAAFGFAITIGAPVGLLVGAVTWLNRILIGPIDFLRSIPAFVILPLFLVFLKTGESARVAMAAFGAGLVVAANTAFGAAHVGRLRIKVARVYGAGPLYRLGVVFMQALPQSLDGARLALSLTLVLTIVGEIMLGATHGLGTRVNDSLAGFDLARMYALIIVVGIVGWLLNRIARWVCSNVAKYGPHL